MMVDDQCTRLAVGQAMAALETDCAQSWPQCPRESVLCDCRLRAVHAISAFMAIDNV